MNHTIYLDNAATTPVSKEVLDAMIPYYCEEYGNPSSIFYSVGSKAHEALANARAKVAASLGCEPAEVFFTSCGTEADNWAIKGTALKFAKLGKKHLITSCIEHHAVLHSMKALEKEGFEVTYLPVDSDGFVSVRDVQNAIRPETALVTIMFANNEIGTLEPIEEIARVCHEKGVWFHTDAVQAVGSVPIDFKKLGVDMLSLSAHKFNGPKGVGALICRRGIMPLNFMDGGAQERGRRAGTENLAGIVGLATALDLAVRNLDKKIADERAMRDYVLKEIQAMPKVKINGPLDLNKRLPNNITASFEAAEGESLLLMLDMKGICASSGSACASGSLDPSHVLLAIGLPHEIAHCSLRISFGIQNTMEDAKAVCTALKEIVATVRERSPLWHP
ncbi:cysteine desulfurase family protein [uncultured Ruthenibacterium sp.]|uniref:cysteine desulfurase family protein n=1 Tax=uncultured Ruthenibacterium sp. TaxID=1905347 RepID=UPI00349F007F